MKSFLFVLYFVIVLFGCKSPEARKPVTVQSGTFLKESANRNLKLKAYEEAQIQTIIKTDTLKKYIASKSGFWYAYTYKFKGDTITPQFGDVVNFDYDISTLNNKQIYSKADIGNQNYTIDKEVLFSGLREGLKIMKPTEKVTFIFPSQKAYGYYGDENKIGANIPIICNVTLNSIIKK